MSGLIRQKREWITHPVLVAVLPVLFLYAYNVQEVLAWQLVRPLAVMLLVSVGLFALLARLLRDGHRAALLCTAFWLWFFAWGRLAGAASGTALQPLFTEQKEMVQAAWFLLLGAAVWVLLRTERPLARLSRGLNVAVLALVSLQLVVIGVGLARTAGGPGPAPKVAAAARQGAELSDVFYIIADGYAQNDTLRRLYGYDNKDFLAALRRRGFYVADNAYSNYDNTLLSLSSSLNLDYLDRVAARVGRDSDNKRPLAAMITDPLLCRLFKSYGYGTSSFFCGYTQGEVSKVDLFIRDVSPLTDFEQAVLATTVMPDVLERLSERFPDEFEQHRRHVRWVVTHLPRGLEVRRPAFVFAHFLCPHIPFVFDKEGKAPPHDRDFRKCLLWDDTIPKPVYHQRYREQLQYLNGLLLQTIDDILAQAGPDTVIILQGDHGPRSGADWEDVTKADTREMMGILNAVRLPGYDGPALRPTLSPVNNTRLLVSHVLGLDYPQLPDESYYSTWFEPYNFVRITDRLRHPTSPAP